MDIDADIDIDIDTECEAFYTIWLPFTYGLDSEPRQVCVKLVASLS